MAFNEQQLLLVNTETLVAAFLRLHYALVKGYASIVTFTWTNSMTRLTHNDLYKLCLCAKLLVVI